MASLVPSDPGAAEGRQQSSIRNLETTAAYDLWSEVYDTDGNFLQILDSIEMQSLLPQMLSLIKAPTPWRIVDLGCGTGRNTCKLLENSDVMVIGLDASARMIEVARSKLSECMNCISGLSTGPKELQLRLYDLLTEPSPPSCALDADGVISTLVLEHIPLPIFFHALHQMLRPGGIALITNMHSEMGNISQAGFLDPQTGLKVRPQSYAHRLEDVLAEARDQRFDLVGDVLETRVDEKMHEKLGVRARKWIGVMVWFGFIIRKNS